MQKLQHDMIQIQLYNLFFKQHIDFSLLVIQLFYNCHTSTDLVKSVTTNTYNSVESDLLVKVVGKL